jgi:hypothetical protein
MEFIYDLFVPYRKAILVSFFHLERKYFVLMTKKIKLSVASRKCIRATSSFRTAYNDLITIE